MKIDHIGYAVKNMQKARRSLEALGFQFQEMIPDENRNIDISFGTCDGYRVELVAPQITCEESTSLDSVLEKNGPTPYHICYKSSNLTADIERLKSARFKVIIPPAPAVAFGGKSVVFLYSLSVGLIELVEE